ncbi:hypothetical protein FHETE_9100 [Fusarium heterosporum]|uniref:Bulb-type lectin domain-containing protein n=1 Tax=Fusarium heterosporum TaxID=42747 RepID=A0A8H5SZP1_FUSHE|nr:hypothetical protein FHETE_9100 [Fusarium heterosporum]
MPLLLVPYDSSMRLGMGFNSYTQTNCISDTVKAEGKGQNSSEQLQDVTFTSKFVQGLSEIASAMKISHSTAIKNGTVEVLDNANLIDEDKIKAADLNLLVSVQVMTQTLTLDSSARFQPLEGQGPCISEFNEIYGDSYISGFITGGEFRSIISIRCLDRNGKDAAIREIKQAINRNIDGAGLDGLSALEDTEITVSVSWNAGGEYERHNQPLTLGSVYEAAAAFPSSIKGKRLQNTWAILTKYTSNRSFQQWAPSQSLRPLDYDILKTYTVELFDRFMEYKHLLKKVQHIMSHGEQYIRLSKDRSIPIETNTLIAVRTVLRNEMDKIVTVVELLSKRPELIAQVEVFAFVTSNSLVRQIMDRALAMSMTTKIIVEPATPVVSAMQSEPVVEFSSGESVSEFQEVHTPGSNISDISRPEILSLPIKHESCEAINIDLGSLIAPEVWADLLPVHKDDAISCSPDNGDGKLKILTAVYGLHDVTHFLRKHVTADQRRNLEFVAINDLIGDEIYRSLTPGFVMNLSFLYTYGDGVMRVNSADYNAESPESIIITRESKHAVVKSRLPMMRYNRPIVAIYGGKVYNTEDVLSKIDKNTWVSTGSQSTLNSGSVRFSNDLMGEDPRPGIQKTGVVFFETLDGEVLAGAGLEGQYCTLTECPQLAELTLEITKENEVVKEVPAKSSNKISKKAAKKAAREAIKQAKSNSTNVGPGIVPQCYSYTFECGRLTVIPQNNEPFLTLDGIQFVCQTDGNFVVYSADRRSLWSSGLSVEDSFTVLSFNENGNLGTLGNTPESSWSPDMRHNVGGKLVLSSATPYIQILNKEGERLWYSV